MKPETTPCSVCKQPPMWRILKSGWQVDCCDLAVTVKPSDVSPDATAEQMQAIAAKTWNDAQAIVDAAGLKEALDG